MLSLLRVRSLSGTKIPANHVVWLKKKNAHNKIYNTFIRTANSKTKIKAQHPSADKKAKQQKLPSVAGGGDAVMLQSLGDSLVVSYKLNKEERTNT